MTDLDAWLPGGTTADPPSWTPELLNAAITAAFADHRRAAAAIGAAPSTLRGWLHRGDTNAPLNLTARSLSGIQHALGPADDTRASERIRLRRAQRALYDLALPAHRQPSTIVAMWRQQGWLEPHVLAVVDVPGLQLRRPVIARAAGDPLSRLPKTRVVDHIVCSNRFLADVAKGRLLDYVAAWRIELPDGRIPRGRTETWLSPAPLPPLPLTLD